MQINSSTEGETLFWRSPLDGLELFRAKNTNYSYPKHSHNAYSIGVIEAGVSVNYCRGKKQYSAKDAIILMNPEEVHTGYSDTEKSSYRMLYLSEDMLEQNLINNQRLPSFKENVIYSPKWARTIKNIHQSFETAQSKLFYEELVFASFSQLSLEFADEPLIASTNEHAAVKQVKDYLEDNYMHDISIDELASLTKLNRAYLMRTFQKSTALPIYSYLLQIRIRHAKNMLINGQDASQIALDLGFSDQSHFIRSFKRITGSTPFRFAKGHYYSRNIKNN